MTLEQAIRAVIGKSATENAVEHVACELLNRGVSEPMPGEIEDAARAVGVCDETGDGISGVFPHHA